jgi:hypothetical protein
LASGSNTGLCIPTEDSCTNWSSPTLFALISI